MFNRHQLIARYKEIVEQLGEDPRDVLLSGGGAMVMMGLRETTADLDLDVADNVFTWAGTHCGFAKTTGGGRKVRFAEDVELHPSGGERGDRGMTCIEGVWLYSLNEMLVQKRYLVSHPLRHSEKRAQDRLDLAALESLLPKRQAVSKVS